MAGRLEGSNMETLDYLVKKYSLDLTQPSPLKIPCNRLIDLPVIFRELGFKSGAEIGVLEGKFSEILCKELPDAQIYSIDKWEWYPVLNNFRKPHNYPPLYETAKAKLAPYKNNHIIREWSMDAVNKFPDNSLDFVFIDANHSFEFITNDIAQWSKKVRPGGIISGHDMGKNTWKRTMCHVEWVVEAWTDSHKIKPWFVLDHPVERSWMWIKEISL
jgi:SAM-dependent methyltransferase